MSRFKFGEPPEELKYKERNSTTLKQCGWCEHASGTHRHDYCIDGECYLIPDTKVYWSKDCVIKEALTHEIKSLVESHKQTIECAKRKIARYENLIEILGSFETIDCPPLPKDRSFDHFSVGDLVMAFYPKEDIWEEGIVCEGRGHYDGCVSFTTVDATRWCGVNQPTILLKEEFDFFRANPKVFEIWEKKSCHKPYNGDIIKFPPVRKWKCIANPFAQKGDHDVIHPSRPHY